VMDSHRPKISSSCSIAYLDVQTESAIAGYRFDWTDLIMLRGKTTLATGTHSATAEKCP
jgi:hypothetical protein